MQKRFGYLTYNHFQSYSNRMYLNKIEIGYSLNNRNVSVFKMFHLIWPIIFFIELKYLLYFIVQVSTV